MNPISEVLKENNKRLRSLLERLFLGGYKSYEIKRTSNYRKNNIPRRW
jgi:hypothetical protein